MLCVLGPVEGCFNKSRVNRCFLEVVQRQLLLVAIALNSSQIAGWIYEVSNNDMQRDENGILCYVKILKDKMINDLKYSLGYVGNVIL